MPDGQLGWLGGRYPDSGHAAEADARGRASVQAATLGPLGPMT
jgi:hypothetical protein